MKLFWGKKYDNSAKVYIVLFHNDNILCIGDNLHDKRKQLYET
jgi:hypothetical protein